MKGFRIQKRKLRDRLTANAGLGFVSLLWGSSFVAIKIAAVSFNAIEIATRRVTIAAVCLGLIVFFRDDKLPRQPNIIVKLFLLSFFGQILPFTCLGISGRLTASGNSAIMMGAAPLVTLLIGRFCLPDESWSWKKWLALAIGFAGVLMALGETTQDWLSFSDTSANDFEGKLYALIAAVGFAIGATLSRMVSREVSPTTGCALTMTISATFLLGYTFFTGANAMEGGKRAWAAIVLLGVVNTAMAYGVYFWLIKVSGATFASLNNYLVPVVGLVLGYSVLGGAFKLNAIVGLVMVLCGVFLFSRASHPTSWAPLPDELCNKSSRRAVASNNLQSNFGDGPRASD